MGQGLSYTRGSAAHIDWSQEELSALGESPSLQLGRPSPHDDVEEPIFYDSPPPSPGGGGRPECADTPSVQTVPTMFCWAHGGEQVYITGSFNKWRERVPLRRSREDFATIIDLPLGTHQYKFIVDDQWRCSPDQPTMPDRSGALNNFLEVTAQPQEEVFDDEFLSAVTAHPLESPRSTYCKKIPHFGPSAKPPPSLPPHCLQAVLNEPPVSLTDPISLAVPSHVMLDHLYVLSLCDGVLAMASTARYNEKYVTTVMYRPVQ